MPFEIGKEIQVNKVYSSFLGMAVVAFIAVGGLISLSGAAKADDGLKDDPDFLSIGAGYYDFNRQKEEGGEFRLEYRSDKKFFFFKPFAAASS